MSYIFINFVQRAMMHMSAHLPQDFLAKCNRYKGYIAEKIASLYHFRIQNTVCRRATTSYYILEGGKQAKIWRFTK